MTAERKRSSRSTSSFPFCTLPFRTEPEETRPARTTSCRLDANVSLVPVRQQQSEKVNATGPEYLSPNSGGGKTQQNPLFYEKSRAQQVAGCPVQAGHSPERLVGPQRLAGWGKADTHREPLLRAMLADTPAGLCFSHSHLFQSRRGNTVIQVFQVSWNLSHLLKMHFGG